MKRREFVAAAGSLTALAGCTSVPLSGGGSRQQDPTTGNGNCERIDLVDVVETDQLGGFTMTANPGAVNHGNTVTIRMMNATSSDQYTGNRRKFTIHEPTADGWQSVYAHSEHVWNDIGIEHPPGEGFTWEIGASQSGFSDAPNGLSACSSVGPGTYRFVYWGLATDEEEASDWEKEYGLGVEFSVSG